MNHTVTVDNMKHHPNARIKDIVDLEKASRNSNDEQSWTSGHFSISTYDSDTPPRWLYYIYRTSFDVDTSQRDEQQLREYALLIEDDIRQQFPLQAYSFIENGKLNIDVWKRYDDLTEEEYDDLTISDVTHDVHEAVNIIKNHQL